MHVWRRIGNNVVSLATPASIEQEARRWVIRKDSDEPLSDAEKEALREWTGRSVLHRSALLRFSQFWSEAEILALLKDRPEYQVPRRTGRVRAILVVTGAIALASVMLIYLVYLGVRAVGEAGPLTYETAVGQQRIVSLSDGSSLQLNTNSRVQVGYGRQMRRVRLLQGEVLFSVTGDSRRVFEVFVADSIVRARSTVFVVRLEGRGVEVLDTTGTVEVSDVADSWSSTDRRWIDAAPRTARLGQLGAGEVGSFDSGSGHMEVRRLAEPEVERRMAWQEGFLAFSGEPLSVVVTELNRYSTTTLEIGDPRLASIKISGRFRIGDLEGVLDLLRKAFGIRARRGSGSGNIRLESAEGRAARQGDGRLHGLKIYPMLSELEKLYGSLPAFQKTGCTSED